MKKKYGKILKKKKCLMAAKNQGECIEKSR